MNREQRREQNKQLAKDNQSWPSELVEWPRNEWPRDDQSARGMPHSITLPDRVWRSRLYLVQQIKRQVGYGEFDAVEVYPDDGDVVNVSNMRHLWILEPGSLPFAWRK